MVNNAKTAITYDEAKSLLNDYGDFHDCYILKMVIDYSAKSLEMNLDDLNSGLISETVQPGVLVLDQIEYLFCQIPFVGGEIRIVGVELKKGKFGLVFEFDLQITMWLDSEEFKTIKISVEAHKMVVKDQC